MDADHRSVRRILFVVPRYGREIPGGVEYLVRKFSHYAAGLDTCVHILTTCAVDEVTWENALPAGFSELEGIPVWRYELQVAGSAARHKELHYQIMTHQPLSVQEQYEWLEIGPHSPALYAHIEQYHHLYDAVLFAPYLFPVIQYGAFVCPSQGIMWPCLHDEAFARFQSTRLMLTGASGILYNSIPERDFAVRRLAVDHPRSAVVGVGVEDYVGDADRFRSRFGLEAPFLLYVGRLQVTKNVHLLMEYFLAYKRDYGGDLKLVLLGKGAADVPRHPDLIPIGYQPEQVKRDAYAAATVLCQPSILESFSIVLMEAWLASVPVLVHGDCAVTRHLCKMCNGGLYFSDEEEFIESLRWLMMHPEVRAAMGDQGRAYVLANYTWDAVTTRALEAIQEWVV